MTGFRKNPGIMGMRGNLPRSGTRENQIGKADLMRSDGPHSVRGPARGCLCPRLRVVLSPRQGGVCVPEGQSLHHREHRLVLGLSPREPGEQLLEFAIERNTNGNYLKMDLSRSAAPPARF